jgi:DNA-binding NtrC family response regulator
VRRSILLIEDEQAQRELMRHVLEPRGFEVTEAENGREGIVHLETRDFAVIILDLRMPGGSGEFVIQWILANRIHLRSRVLIVTGDLLSPGLEMFLTKVQIPMLQKPYLLAQLIDSVEDLAEVNGFSKPATGEFPSNGQVVSRSRA